MRLMEALRLTPDGLSGEQAGGRDKAGYLDIVEAVRGRRWEAGTNKDNPLRCIAKEAKRRYRDGEQDHVAAS